MVYHRASRQIQGRTSAGFTVIEILVTVVVAALFVITITQLHITQSKVVSIMTSLDSADLLAYNNLRTFAYGKAPSWFQCIYASGSPQPMTLLNITDDVDGIPSPVIQSVVATAPYGCGGSSTTIGYPIRVVSKVTYGSDARTVVHATYATY